MKVLIIEDNEKLVKSLKKGLEQEGYAVDFKLDGESGLRWLEMHNKNCDVVVLDVMLPNIDGFTVCKRMREKNINVPVLMLTARDLVQDKITGLDSGADDYLIKPFSFEELTARLRSLLRRPAALTQPEFALGNLKLNLNNRQAFYKNEEIRLTLKEFSLLEYLMRHPNQVINREQLLDHVWDSSFDSFSNVVDVHIKNLRKKLQPFGHEEILETVRGLGYRLKA
jgi:DNA-binding response OmpR family regulator